MCLSLSDRLDQYCCTCVAGVCFAPSESAGLSVLPSRLKPRFSHFPPQRYRVSSKKTLSWCFICKNASARYHCGTSVSTTRPGKLVKKANITCRNGRGIAVEARKQTEYLFKVSWLTPPPLPSILNPVCSRKNSTRDRGTSSFEVPPLFGSSLIISIVVKSCGLLEG